MGKHLDVVPFSGIIRIRDMMYSIENPFRLDQGDVSFDAPETVKAAMRRAIDENKSHYLQTTGVPRLLDLLAAKLRRANGIPVGHSDEVMVTTGGIHAVYLICQALLEPGDEVILPDPTWPPCAGNVLAAQARPVGCPLHESLDWRFDLDELESCITPATRAIYVNSPHNPTGGVLTRADVERIAAIVRERNLWLISDEAYEDVVFDGAAHVSPASLPGMYERTISIYTFSKSYAMTGLRLGYLVDARCGAPRAHQEGVVLHLQQRHLDRAVRGHRRARGIAGLGGAVPRRAAGPARPLLRRHSRARRRAAHRRAAARRLLRIPAHRSGMAPRARQVAVVGTGRAAHLARTHRLRPRRGLRPARRGLHPVLLRPGSA